jgi:hypothetical protein
MNAVIRPEPASLLTQLAERRMFILARPDKHPCDIEGRDSNAQNPLTWLPPAEAATVAELLGLHVGIVLSESCGLGCVDIDSALQPDGTWSPLALELCGRFPGAYIEISLSGRGLHIFFSYSGPLPKHRTRWTPPGAANGLHVELYSAARYMLTTGTNAMGDARTDHTAALHALIAERFAGDESSRDEAEWTTEPVPQWSGPPDTDEGNRKLIEKAKRSRSANAIFGKGASFTDLYDGSPDPLARAYPPQSSDQAWDYSAADLALANHLAFWTGGNAERIERLMHRSGLSRPKHERASYLRGTILRACASAAERGKYYNDGKTAPAPTDSDPREVILLKGGEFEKNIAKLQPLIASNVYVRGGALVRIGQAEEISDAQSAGTPDTKRAAKQAVCIPVSAHWLRLELMRVAQFWKFDSRSNEWEPRDCPAEIAESIVKQQTWPMMRPLLTIASVPVLRSDLSVWVQPGYDAVTAAYYQPTMAIPPVLPTPTREDALQALARLREPFNEFPFASRESEAVFISHILGSVLRPSFDTSPIFIYTSPIAGTGKTLLADMPSLIASGVVPAHSPYSEGEELRKVLFASLLAGDAALTLDNVPNGLKVRAPGLCGFATSANYSDRVLGASENRKIPNRCTVTLTGNNITPMSDMARRSAPCRLDVNAESARGRTFRIADLKAYVLERRAQFIVDVLTIVRAYAFAGRPPVARPLESFEQWSRLARDPLMWLGMADAVKAQESETDDELSPLQGAFAAIAGATYGQEYRFTSAQLAMLTIPQAPTVIGAQTANALRDALINAGCTEPADAKKLGYWLREQRDRVAGGWKLISERTPANTAGWQLRSAQSVPDIRTSRT